MTFITDNFNFFFLFFQQLAALLIARQVIGNLKESALPYLLEQMRLAKLSFDLWGALSPTGTRSPPGTEQTTQEGEKSAEKTEKPPEQESSQTETSPDQPTAKRTISQAELESSLFKVKPYVLLLFPAYIVVVVYLFDVWSTVYMNFVFKCIKNLVHKNF